MLRFDNKVVVVTGARSGIGKVAAIMFARQGAKVVATCTELTVPLYTEAVKKRCSSVSRSRRSPRRTGSRRVFSSWPRRRPVTSPIPCCTWMAGM
jgi:NAD(P)-dependent dehydrogenase (short-subunit alcohol dehydrogenase family)